MAHPAETRPNDQSNRSTEAPASRASEGGEAATAHTLPEDAIVIIPVRGFVLFPGVVAPVSLGRQRSIAAAQEAARSERPIGLLLQANAEADSPTPSELAKVGTVANLMRYVTAPDGTHHVVVQGERRFQVKEFLDGYPFLVARVEMIGESEVMTRTVEARFQFLKERALEGLQLLPQVPSELVATIQRVTSPSQLADLVASTMDIKPEEKQEILETFEVETRLEKVGKLLVHRIEVLKLTQEIGRQTKASIDERQREFLLREQMSAIQKELGETSEKQVEIAELSKKIDEAGMPEDVEAHTRKELKRLERMPDASAEYSMVRTYLEWLIELPWKAPAADVIDIAEARRILDEDHYGLDKVKKRILEFLAVRKLAPEGKSPILCLVGPPGVGKTSLGQSIARAMKRPFQRVSLGGVHDEAEIRGHRRTYIGALPGNIVQAIRKAGSRGGVLMLDELDKLGGGAFHGDPSSALLEVLDPEQNSTFRDNYLGVPFDLSRVVFIGTANVLDSIPGPLRDRMEVIHLPGYTEEEKLQIAKRYLVRRQLESNGLKPEQVTIEDEALKAIIRGYTREAGVRNLEREIGTALRNVAMRIAEGVIAEAVVRPDDLADPLGPAKFENEAALRTSVPGVATGLAWTPVGGDILFIEASRVPGGGKLILTGQLGDVMKESAQAAMSLVKAMGPRLGIAQELFDKSDIHVHVPAGAIPKDGPSAGVALFMALTSLMTGKKVRSDTAMTGEISLRGLVLPVGGIKEKVLAAARAGITTVMLPARNKRDWADIPEGVRDTMKFIWLERVEQAIAHAIEGLDVPELATAAA
jgi:ATP-dependent Lon protease